MAFDCKKLFALCALTLFILGGLAFAQTYKVYPCPNDAKDVNSNNIIAGDSTGTIDESQLSEKDPPGSNYNKYSAPMGQWKDSVFLNKCPKGTIFTPYQQPGGITGGYLIYGCWCAPISMEIIDGCGTLPASVQRKTTLEYVLSQGDKYKITDDSSRACYNNCPKGTVCEVYNSFQNKVSSIRNNYNCRCAEPKVETTQCGSTNKDVGTLESYVKANLNTVPGITNPRYSEFSGGYCRLDTCAAGKTCNPSTCKCEADVIVAVKNCNTGKSSTAYKSTLMVNGALKAGYTGPVNGAYCQSNCGDGKTCKSDCSSCICAPANCAANEKQNPTTCKCECDPSKLTCPTGQSADGGACKCKCDATTSDAKKCTSTSGSWSTYPSSIDSKCSCICPAGKRFDSTKGCICPQDNIDTCSAAGGTLQSDCSCKCPTGKTLDAASKKCVCNNKATCEVKSNIGSKSINLKKVDVNCACVCNPDAQYACNLLGSGYSWNSGTCTCNVKENVCQTSPDYSGCVDDCKVYSNNQQLYSKCIDSCKKNIAMCTPGSCGSGKSCQPSGSGCGCLPTQGAIIPETPIETPSGQPITPTSVKPCSEGGINTDTKTCGKDDCKTAKGENYDCIYHARANWDYETRSYVDSCSCACNWYGELTKACNAKGLGVDEKSCTCGAPLPCNGTVSKCTSPLTWSTFSCSCVCPSSSPKCDPIAEYQDPATCKCVKYESNKKCELSGDFVTCINACAASDGVCRQQCENNFEACNPYAVCSTGKCKVTTRDDNKVPTACGCTDESPVPAVQPPQQEISIKVSVTPNVFPVCDMANKASCVKGVGAATITKDGQPVTSGTVSFKTSTSSGTGALNSKGIAYISAYCSAQGPVDLTATYAGAEGTATFNCQ